MVVGNYQVLSKKPSTGSITIVEEFTSSEAVRESFFDRRILHSMAWNKLVKKKFLNDNELRFVDGILYEDNLWTYSLVKKLRHMYVIPDITYHYSVRPLSICSGTSEREKAKHSGIAYEYIARRFTPGEEAREVKYYLGNYYGYFIMNRKIECFKRALPFFEKALAGDEYRKERFTLLIVASTNKVIINI